MAWASRNASWARAPILIVLLPIQDCLPLAKFALCQTLVLRLHFLGKFFLSSSFTVSIALRERIFITRQPGTAETIARVQSLIRVLQGSDEVKGRSGAWNLGFYGISVDFQMVTWCRSPEDAFVFSNMHERPGVPWKYCPRNTLQRLSQTLRMSFNLVRMWMDSVSLEKTKTKICLIQNP